MPVEVSHTPSSVHVGDEVTFLYSIKNQGLAAAPARSYEVEFYVEDELVSFDRGTSGLEPNRSNSYSKYGDYYHFKPKKAGEISYRVVVDPKGSLVESDEKNNILRGQIEVLPAVKKEIPNRVDDGF